MMCITFRFVSGFNGVPPIQIKDLDNDYSSDFATKKLSSDQNHITSPCDCDDLPNDTDDDKVTLLDSDFIEDDAHDEILEGFEKNHGSFKLHSYKLWRNRPWIQNRHLQRKIATHKGN